MTRDLRRLADTRFDVIIVGAGFYGALAAWDASLRGLSVALVDKADFGAGTSFNNLKTLHGGLRSLQAMNLRQMRLFIRERRALARVAPHLVHPLAFIVPTYAHPLRSAATMRVALAMNDVISHDRHDGIIDPALWLPRGQIVSREECLRRNPLIDPTQVTGGAVWHDYQMHNSDRMTFSFIASAVKRGAAAANYLQAARVLLEGTKVCGLRVHDVFTGDAFDIRGSGVVNATGAWAASFLKTLEKTPSVPAPRLSRAMNLVTRALPVTQGCGGRARGRFLFLAPWRGVSLLGTSHDVHDGEPDALAVSAADLARFLDAAREAFPGAHLASGDVRLVHRGLLPMVNGHGHHVQLLRESAVVDHAADGVTGLISMFGVRYTTARDTAARAVDAVFRARGVRHPPKCLTDYTPVVGGGVSDKASFIAAAERRQGGPVTTTMLRRLALTYGTQYDAVLLLADNDPALAAPLGKECTVSGAEILWAVRREFAITLADALIRRTEAGSAGHPGRDAVANAAAIMAKELDWDEERVRSQIAQVEEFYRVPIDHQ
jgi:glycerol-3-phosphate dehydrogenase